MGVILKVFIIKSIAKNVANFVYQILENSYGHRKLK
jgi:hypothetical protein